MHRTDQDEARGHPRLNFSAARPDQIREGIRRLEVAVKAQLDELRSLATGAG